jgi:hypothetical protein
MKRNLYGSLGRIAVMAVACAATVASAQNAGQVDDKCMQQWNDAVATQNVGTICKVGDPASMAQFKADEDAALNCAVAKLSPTAAADVRANAAKTKVAMAKQMATQACPSQAKAFYQQRTTQKAPITNNR